MEVTEGEVHPPGLDGLEAAEDGEEVDVEKAEIPYEDPGTPLEAENPDGTAVENEEEGSSDDEDDIQITIGDIKHNVAFRQLGGSAATPKTSGTAQKPAGKLDIDATAEVDGTPIYDVDLATMEEKPWRKPGADITDYFNYGFTEETWNIYCERQKKLRAEFGQQNANKVLFSSLVVGQSRIEKKESPPKMIVNLAEKYRVQPTPIQTPIFRTILTPSGALTGSPSTSAIPVIGLSSSAAPDPVPSMELPSQNLTVLVSNSNPPLQSLVTSSVAASMSVPAVVASMREGPPGVEEPGPPGSSPHPPGADTPPPCEISAPQPIHVNVSVPPPRFSTTNTSIPPPGFNVPPPGFAPRGMPPTNVPPPGFGNPPPPGIMGPRGFVGFAPLGRPPMLRPTGPPGVAPPPLDNRAYAGFRPDLQEGERSPASYSDKSSDVDERDYGDQRHRSLRSSGRRDYSYRSSGRRSRSPTHERRSRRHGDRDSGAYHRRHRSPTPDKDARASRSRRRDPSGDEKDERKKDDKSAKKKIKEEPVEDEAKDKKKKRRKDEEEEEGREAKRSREEDKKEDQPPKKSRRIKEEKRDK